MAQRCRCGITGILGVPADELFRQLRSAEPLQIHGQEGGVVKPVHPAQPVIEVQAVKNPRPVIQAEDVIGEQIAMPIDDAPGLGSCGKERVPLGQEPIRQVLGLVDD